MLKRNLLRSGMSFMTIFTLSACGETSLVPVIPPVTEIPSTGDTPPTEEIPSTTGRTVFGPISGFGSLIINGVRYDTRSAQFTIDGNPGTQSDLKVGQVVVVKSERDSFGDNIASSVDYEEILEGPISSISRVDSRLIILGRTVLIDNLTSFDRNISPSSIDGLMPGDVLEISGQFNSDGDILATRIEKSDDQSIDNTNEIHGIVSNLDTVAMTFDLGGLTVGYGSAGLEDFGDRDIENGDFVEVEGTVILDGTFIATRVENENDDNEERQGEENDEAEILGLINRFESIERFTIAGVTIITNSATRFEGGIPAEDLGPDVQIEVEGYYNGLGELIAEKIEFEGRSEIEFSSRIEAIDQANNRLTVLGVDFTVTARTRYEDNEDGASQTFSFANLAVGDLIEVTAFEDSFGNLIASKIEREDDNDREDDGDREGDDDDDGFNNIGDDDDDFNDRDDDDDRGEIEIEGPVSAIGSDFSLTVRGITIQTDNLTRYEIDDNENINQSQFFNQLQIGDIIEAEGSLTATQTLLAQELSIEHSDSDFD